MEGVSEIGGSIAEPAGTETGTRVQAHCWLLELSLDWIVLRASENAHKLLGESHVRLIDEPLGSFVHSDALHDLRNLFSRLSATTGIARAYRVRLTDEPLLVDVAFQLRDGRILLEAMPSAESFGERFGSVGGLIAGLAGSGGQALLDNGTRRMRALTGYDRVTLIWGDLRSDSSRGGMTGPADPLVELPALLADSEGATVGLFPAEARESSADSALMRAPRQDEAAHLRASGIRSVMRIAFTADGVNGEFRCEGKAARMASIEHHAAAELFAQMFALRLEKDGLEAAQPK